MKGILNKGFVKYSLALVVLVICLILFTLYGPATGKGELHNKGLATGGTLNQGPSVEVMNFYEVVDNEGEEEPPEIKDSGNKPPETASSPSSFGGVFSGGGSSSGGTSVQCSSVQCPPPTHKVCDYGQQACIVVQGSGANECETFEDCIHTECDYDEGVCLTVESPGDDECRDDEDCIECIPPYLQVDKEANPTELVCEETSIKLTVEGKGKPCPEYYPVDVVLIFDNSGSMDDDGWDDNISDWQPIGDAKTAAKVFVDLLESDDKLGLVSFNTKAKLEQGLTFNKNAVKSAIDGMSAGGWTNMSQGMEYATKELVSNGREDLAWIEILLSDGNNNCGSKNPPPDCHQKVFSQAVEASSNGIVIYTIALGDQANQSLMQEIADLTGGKFYYAPGTEDLEEIYEEIVEEFINNTAGTNVVVVDYLPDYVELNESSLPGECEYSEGERKITCELGMINVNETFVVEFGIYVHQLGYNLTNVYPDSGVEYKNYNSSYVFEEFPETYVTAYGCEHNVCNYVDMICDVVVETEPGDDECQTFADCPQHRVCDYDQQACVILEGAGMDECSTYEDCFHDICDYKSLTCESVPISMQGDACETDEDCYHLDCVEISCVPVMGGGDDSCSQDSDCYYMHCDYGQEACLPAIGSGDDECSTFDDCTHTECNYQLLTCDTLVSQGTSECQTFDDCPQHRVCDYDLQACKIVEGSGTDECQTYGDCFHDICDYSTFTCKERPVTEEGDACAVNSDCYDKICDYGQQICKKVEPGTPGTSCNTYDDCVHTECCDMSCITLQSQGIDECVTDADCTDYVCQDISCVAVAGTGQVECVNDDECRHYECNYDLEICEVVAGDGVDECETFEDCYYCGDGVLNPGEECEIAGIYAGWGSWGHEYTCKEDNTYYKCVNCKYEHVNECEYYCSGDFECDGHPPMTYLETCDYGYAYLQDYCNEICELEDNNCEDDYAGCTSEPECDELEPNTGDCNYMCQYKPSHMECDYQKLICKLVGTAGEDECQTFDDCPQHRVCDYDLQACKIVEGSGTDECQTWDDCLYCGDGEVNPPEECELPSTTNNLYCSQTTSACEGNKTKTRDAYGNCDSACGCVDDPWGTPVCVEGQCGATCDEDTDCPCPKDGCVGKDWYTYPEHGVCTDDCVCDVSQEPCQGPCKPTITPDDPRCTHYVCDYDEQTCNLVEGDGEDECSTWGDCIHTECNYQSLTCDTFMNKGTSECVTFEDCPQHNVCDYDLQACRIAEGEGIDECTTWKECVHTVCNYYKLTCDTVMRPGTYQCITFDDCPQHRVCDYDLQACKIVEGSGTDECQTWDDCLYCGDGEVNPPEECELPSTTNNLYCSQTTSACSGKKLGTRDAYGNCDSACGCVDDPFSYSCVKGQCGAACDSDDDCVCPSDGCEGVDYYDYPDHSECLDDCTCSECQPEISHCDPRCMGNCDKSDIVVRVGHVMIPQWGYPYTATDDIYIEVMGSSDCIGLTVPIEYWWCSCPNKDPEQSAIESTHPIKYDRLCTMDAGQADTWSLACGPCPYREKLVTFTSSNVNKWIRLWTGCGSSTGTFQIDLDNECYTPGHPPALGCAAASEDHPVHKVCDNQACVEVSGYGTDQCSTNSDCIITHYECRDMTCAKISGSGTDECSLDCDCYYHTCDYANQQCAKVAGTEADQCSVWSDCVHKECNYQTMTCDVVNSPGTDSCSVNSECAEYHTECIGFRCESVIGYGPDECYGDWDCEIPMV